MSTIHLESETAKKIYSDYIRRVKGQTSVLSDNDASDLLMEINSHIHEGMKESNTENEIDKLLDILKRLGDPEDYLKPLVANKKLREATKTFNPKHVFKALQLNISRGFRFLVLSLFYMFLGIFLLLILAEIFWPDHTGLFYQNGVFKSLGYVSDTKQMNEVLGFWFTPLALGICAVCYLLITLLLRLTQQN